MQRSSKQNPAQPVFQRKRRRLLLPTVIVLIILALAWTGGWFWLARWVDRAAASTLNDLAQHGVIVECQDRGVVGFPFAVRVACGNTAVAERSTDTKASFSGVSGGASVFAPMTADVSLASPARLDSPRLGSADMRWARAGLGIGLGMNGPRDVSFDAANLEAAIDAPRLPVQKVLAKSAEGSLSPSAEGGSNVSARFEDLRVSTNGAELPPVSGTAAAELSAPPRALLAGRAALQAPVWARKIDVALESGGAIFRVAGDIAVDGEGVVDGRLALRVAGAEALPAVIAALPQDWQKLGNAIAGGLFAFGKATTIDGKPASELAVEITRGNAKIGPVELTLPKLPI